MGGAPKGGDDIRIVISVGLAYEFCTGKSVTRVIGLVINGTVDAGQKSYI